MTTRDMLQWAVIVVLALGTLLADALGMGAR